MGELLLKFAIGGIVVSLFAVISDILKPKSFSGLFGAAPSIALASLGLAFAHHGRDYVSVEGRSMILGAIGFFLYSQITALALMRARWHALPAAVASLAAWFAGAFGLWGALERFRQ